VTTQEIRTEVDRARELLEGILSRMKIPAGISVREEEDRIVLDVRCEDDDDTQRVIGRRGQVVDALQHLVGKMLVRHRPERGKPIVVDTDGYRQRHIERLEGLAARTAEKCLERGRPVDLNPMPAHDRRIIHMAIARLSGVATRSEGEGDDRHIVVLPSAE
jgi:spoIIIJ-associated protein